MKIVRIVYDWPPPWQGLAPHPYELTVSQAKLGHQIFIFCGRWPKAGPIENPESTTIYPIIREPFRGTISFTSSVILFFKYLLWRRKNKDVDIIHSHGHFAIWIYLYRLFLQKFMPWSDELKTPLVVHFHNTVKGRWEALKKEGQFIMPHSRFMAWPIWLFSDKISIKVAAACIFVGEDTKNEATKYYKTDPKRCFVVETGVNVERFHKIGEEERAKTRGELGLDMYDKVILNHGIMTERKNIHLLVEMMKFLPDIYKLFLVGPFDPIYLQKVEQIIKNKNLEKRIIKVGYTPYPQTPIAFQAADIFVLPSSFEGVPKVVMQALSTEVSCLVSGFKLNEKIKGLYYLENTEPKTIARQILEIMKNPVSVDVVTVAQKYSWDKKAKEVEKIYDFAKNNYLL